MHCIGICIALHCIALHCICIALHCIALHCIALHCIALHCIALHCIIALLHYCTALHCIVLYCTASHCIALLWKRLLYMVFIHWQIIRPKVTSCKISNIKSHFTESKKAFLITKNKENTAFICTGFNYIGHIDLPVIKAYPWRYIWYEDIYSASIAQQYWDSCM